MPNLNSTETLKVQLVVDQEIRGFSEEGAIYEQNQIATQNDSLKQESPIFSLLLVAIAVVALLLLISGLYLNPFLFYTNGFVFLILVDRLLKEKYFHSDDLDIEY